MTIETLETLSQYEICEVPKSEAKKLIIREHYSHRWGSTFGLYNYGIRLDGELLGVACYGHLMNPQSFGSVADLNAEQVTELNRLWIDDRLGKNTETWLMAEAHKRLLRDTPVRLVQSFADGRLGVGTIYQAANFGYYGHSTTRFHRNVVDGQSYHDTPFSNTANHGIYLRNAMHARGELETFTVNTYRYLKPLTKAAGRRIKLKAKPYPKERKGITLHPDYIPPIGQVVRGCAMAIIDSSPVANDLLPYIQELGCTPGDIEKAVNNAWIVERAKKRDIDLNNVHDTMKSAIMQPVSA